MFAPCSSSLLDPSSSWHTVLTKDASISSKDLVCPSASKQFLVGTVAHIQKNTWRAPFFLPKKKKEKEEERAVAPSLIQDRARHAFLPCPFLLWWNIDRERIIIFFLSLCPFFDQGIWTYMLFSGPPNAAPFGRKNFGRTASKKFASDKVAVIRQDSIR